MTEKILVTDDEKEIAELVELYLQNEGFKVIKAYNGEQALKYISEEMISLAILDVMLPDTNGFDLCRIIRKQHTFPIIMLTAKTEDIDKITGLTIGADDYVTKPFNPLELTARVKTQLRRRKLYDKGGIISDGIYPIVSEGYRTSEEQQQMMNDKIDAYIYEGYTYEEAERSARLAVAEVGKSEHQLGLAIDINSDETYSSDKEVYDWLFENAYKYGFILRYPADKTDITGIEYEPWHYRYTGRKAAEEIHSQGICLEEYLQNGLN